VKQFGWLEGQPELALDPCRLVRQVKQFRNYCSVELVHLPDKPAGVQDVSPAWSS
jgi:hypothetical protein